MSAVAAPAIDLRGWGFRYHGRDRPAIRGLDLSVPAGQRVLLLGASGSGKSTVLRALAGLTEQAGEAEGELLVHGEAPQAGSGRCGYVWQDPAAALVMARAADDVAFGLENLAVPPAQIWPRVRQALATVGLAGFDQRDTHRLSGGEQQRLVLAGVAAMRPRLLLLDEPTALLDPAGAAEVRTAVGDLVRAAGATMVLVEHRVADWLDQIDRVIVLNRDRGVVADGEPKSVFAQADALARLGVWVPGAVEPSTGSPRPARPAQAARSARPASRLDLPTAGSTVIRADALRLRYPDAPSDAVAGVDAQIRAGSVLALTGPNGAGKSTVGRMLAGLVQPTSGAAWAVPSDAAAGRSQRRGRRSRQDRPLHRWRSAELARLVGMVFQNPEHQFVATTVAGELAVGQRLAGVDASARRQRVEQLLERLGLTALAQADPFTLSGGEQRRLSVATALASAPAAVVLDEPTYGQDRNTWAELVRLLDEVRADGVGLCVISHDMQLVDRLADEVLALDHGVAVQASDRPADGRVAS